MNDKVTNEETAIAPKSKLKRIIIGVIALCFCSLLAFGIYHNSTPEMSVAGIAITKDAFPTNTLLPTDPLESTNTLLPPQTNIATASPLPISTTTFVLTETPTPQTEPTSTLTILLPTRQPATGFNLPLSQPVSPSYGTTVAIVPTQPTTIDDIEIAVAGTTVSCIPVYQSYQINKNVIQIEARQATICGAIETNWEFNFILAPLPAGEYRIEFHVMTDETSALWEQTSFTVESVPTVVPTLTCDEKLRAEGQYIIQLDETQFTDGITDNGETVAQIAERLTTKYGGAVIFVYDIGSFVGFSAKHLSQHAANDLATETEVALVSPDICAQGAGG